MKLLLTRYIILFVAACALVSCALESFDAASPQSPEDGDKKPKPTIPIKRRPIVPGTQLPRPRIIISVDITIDRVMSLQLSADVENAHVELWSADMAESWSVVYSGDGRAVELPITSDATSVVLKVTADGVTYSEIIEL